MNKTEELGIKPIGKLLAKYSIPAIIAMLVNAIYNVVDRIFIGNFAGENALAGLTITFPVMLIIFAFASLVGAGGAAVISIRLGEKDQKGASHAFGNTLGTGLIIAAATLITIFFKLEDLLILFGASPNILNYALDYMRIILGGFIFQMFAFTLNNTVRTEGHPMLSMTAMLSSALTNIILDYLFIVRMNMGVQGAAYATIIGQFSGFALLLSFYLRGKSCLKPRLKDFFPEPALVGKILSIGFATFAGTLGTSIAMTFLNRGLGKYGGTPAIASMGAINSLFTLFIMPIFGIQQGLQPIIGYNYGAKLMDRVYKALRSGIIVGIVFSTIVFIALQSFPATFVALFLKQGSSTIKVAVTGLRYFMLMLPILSINLIGVVFFQSTDRGRISMGLSMLRQFIFLVPLVLILPHFMGMTGVWIATPIADALAVLITIAVLIRDKRKNSESGLVESFISEEDKRKRA